MSVRVAIVAVATGCGFHPTTAPTDARDAAPADMEIDTPLVPCHDRWLDGSIRFHTPKRLDTLSSATAADHDPYVTPDGLTIYFSSDRADQITFDADVYIATRADVAAEFGTPMLFPAATTTADDGKVSLTDDGLHLVTTNNTLVDYDLYESSRATASDTFGALSTSHFGSTIDNGSDQQDPWISNDGTRIYYALHTNVQHIAITTRTAIDQNFQAPMMVAGVDSDLGDADPALSADERILVFTSKRPLPSFAGTNIWFATRADPSGAFDPPHDVPDLNTGSNDGDPVLSADGCTVYFASDVAGSYDLYAATMM